MHRLMGPLLKSPLDDETPVVMRVPHSEKVRKGAPPFLKAGRMESPVRPFQSAM